ncbi:MAG: hypothetical protein HY070_07125 [Chloroflexi bacterium]|nr:hypothetical protein [Chloroflexota bacterium]MBI3740334.1 hypothetical protein [Chloroflexota bacterium]
MASDNKRKNDVVDLPHLRQAGRALNWSGVPIVAAIVGSLIVALISDN